MPPPPFLHKQGLDDATITYLNINKQITSVVAAPMLSGVERDLLLVGTASNVQCYDVENNKDLFFKVGLPQGPWIGFSRRRVS
eukprot:103597-Chlamydomonas_euryale.AAC.10